MNICVLTHTFPRNEKDTAAAFMEGLCDGYVAAGNKVFVVTPFDKNFNRSGDLFKIVTYKYIWPNSLHILGYSQTMEADIKLKARAYLLLPFMLLFGTFALLKTVRREKMDVINVHWVLPNGLMALIVSKITGVPYVITLPGTDAYLATRFRIFGIVSKVIADNSAGIVSNSSWILKKFLSLGVRKLPSEVISYPSDAAKMKPTNEGLSELRQKLDFSKKAIIVLAIGRLVYKKGFEYLIKALPVVLKENSEIRLVIGGDGDLRENLENLAQKLDVLKKVTFTGTINRDEILKYYNLADIFIAPSVVDKYGNFDGGPVSSFESMACGKPQIATDFLGVADYIKDGVNGFKIPQKDPKAIAEAIIRLASSKILRQKMGKINRKLIAKNLSTRAVGLKYHEFFKEIVG